MTQRWTYAEWLERVYESLLMDHGFDHPVAACVERAFGSEERGFLALEECYHEGQTTPREAAEWVAEKWCAWAQEQTEDRYDESDLHRRAEL